MPGCYIIEDEVRQKDGSLAKERLIVASLDGHPDATLLAKSSRWPEPGEIWNETAKRWKICPDMAAERERAIQHTPAALLARIEALEARLDGSAGKGE